MKNNFTNMPDLDMVRANKDHFSLKVKGLEGQTVQVLGFEGMDHGFSQDYYFTVNVTVQHAPVMKDFVGLPAQLRMAWDADYVYINGIISNVTHRGKKLIQKKTILQSPRPCIPCDLIFRAVFF
jgi:uncharacterized protein involved in type VI secretion and phage assembly